MDITHQNGVQLIVLHDHCYYNTIYLGVFMFGYHLFTDITTTRTGLQYIYVPHTHS